MKVIYLTNTNKTTLVDDEDYEKLSQYKWYISSCGYALRKGRKLKGEKQGKAIYMHRLILNLVDSNRLTDHVSGNRLDNRKLNLRACNRQENAANSKSRKGTSKYKGVYWHKKGKKWVSGLKPKGKYVYLGCFDDEIEAAKAYDNKVKELFGEFAKTNF